MDILTALAERSQQLPDTVWMQLADDGEIVAYHHTPTAGAVVISGAQWQQQVNMYASHVIDGEPNCGIRSRDAALDGMMQRRWRDNELLATDRYTLADYPITPERKAEVLAYRQGLRDYPQTGIKPMRPAWL